MFMSWIFQLRVWEYVLVQIFVTMFSALLMVTLCCGVLSCLTRCCFGDILKEVKEQQDVERGTGNGPKRAKKVVVTNMKKNGSAKSGKMSGSESGAASIAVVTFKAEAGSGKF